MNQDMEKEVVKLPHHEQKDFCTSRAFYRQGKRLTSVKVYTVNDESQHLLVCKVPAVGLQDELHKLCLRFGGVKAISYVPDYKLADSEFTDVFHVLYVKIQAARFAKKHLDGRSFFGDVLHVCYAPELETLSECRAKLIQRRREIALRSRVNLSEGLPQQLSVKRLQRKKKHPALPLTANRLTAEGLDGACVWQGGCVSKDPRTVCSAAQDTDGPLQKEDYKERMQVYRKDSVWTPGANLSTAIASCSGTLKFLPRHFTKRIVFHNKASASARSVAAVPLSSVESTTKYRKTTSVS